MADYSAFIRKTYQIVELCISHNSQLSGMNAQQTMTTKDSHNYQERHPSWIELNICNFSQLKFKQLQQHNKHWWLQCSTVSIELVQSVIMYVECFLISVGHKKPCPAGLYIVCSYLCGERRWHRAWHSSPSFSSPPPPPRASAGTPAAGQTQTMVVGDKWFTNANHNKQHLNNHRLREQARW